MTTPESVAAQDSGLPLRAGSGRSTPDGERRRKRAAATDSVPPNSSPTLIDAAGASGAHDALIGSTVGKYRVLRKLGEGGMGAVYEGVHGDIGQRAAIKVLHSHLSQQPKFVKRFVDEARLVSMVGHPGLVKVYDYTKTDQGTLCIVMEFLEGESLWHRFERWRNKAKTSDASPGMPVPEVLQIVRQVASALAAVHARGIVHRDLKPDNIMLVKDPDTPSGERAKILDFGIAKLDGAEGGTRNTTTGVSLGTPTYMAPEQIEASTAPTERIDVYALGVITYELLSGGAPFVSETTGGILRQHLIKEPPPLPAHVPAALQDLVRAALAKESIDRPTMAQVVERIDQMAPLAQLAPMVAGGAVPGGAAVRMGASLQPTQKVRSAPKVRIAVRLSTLLAAGGAVLLVAAMVVGWIWLHSATPTARRPRVEDAGGRSTVPAGTPPQQATVPPSVGPEKKVETATGISPGEAKGGSVATAPTPPVAGKKTAGKGDGKRGSSGKGMRFGDLPNRGGK